MSQQIFSHDNFNQENLNQELKNLPNGSKIFINLFTPEDKCIRISVASRPSYFALSVSGLFWFAQDYDSAQDVVSYIWGHVSNNSLYRWGVS
jgi:hypothetical protein